MTLFLVLTLTASLGANAGLAYALVVRRATRRPVEQRPAPRMDPHPVDPSRPYRTGSARPRSVRAVIPTQRVPRVERIVRSPLGRPHV